MAWFEVAGKSCNSDAFGRIYEHEGRTRLRYKTDPSKYITLDLPYKEVMQRIREAEREERRENAQFMAEALSENIGDVIVKVEGARRKQREVLKLKDQSPGL